MGRKSFRYEDFNQDVIVRSFLLGLRENFNTTTEAICFVSEKVNEIICLETKIRVSMIKESLRRNHDNFLIDYETELIMDCVSPFAEPFENFIGKKSLDRFIQKQKVYVTPMQINIGFDPISQKQEFIQHVPVFSTLEIILQHEDVLSVLYAENDNNNASTNYDRKKLRSYRDGIAHRENGLFSCFKDALQICLYHDGFNTVNPLGNKTQKYEVSAFYFVRENFSGKYKSRFKDIHLAILSPASLANKYGYKEILTPLLEELLKPETLGIKVSFQGVDHTFFGSL